MERWKMNRMGILNFWFYDEEIFEFQEGRMILRGSNGSGKSVTMQSFIPLVLDGDKRPKRLDSFGSRDRKIEYYLLGDGDNGHMDRTGYLWIEFYHKEKRIHKTIGIGLHAKRGASQVHFWGFLLDDGRRMNYDFYLYDHNRWLEDRKKIPLNRKTLIEKISAGGIVVQEQAAYRDLVNKSIFGFRECDSYKDLLNLLLEIRSPKLSKEFRPSSIYNILTNSLPVLTEEDLGGLSDVIEDMDQISDRLEELQMQIYEMESLEKRYDAYNKISLYESSLTVKEAEISCQNHRKLSKDLERQLVKQNDYGTMLQNKISKSEIRKLEIQTELEYLQQSEVLEKHLELERLESEFDSLNTQSSKDKEKLKDNQERIQNLQTEIAEKQIQIEDLKNAQANMIEELENHARIMGFSEHDIYHRQWGNGFINYEQWADNWRNALEAHQDKLKEAVELGEEERKTYLDMGQEKERWGEYYLNRCKIESNYGGLEEKFSFISNKLKGDIVCWYQKLSQLRIETKELSEILIELSKISVNKRDYKLITQRVENPFKIQNYQIINEILNLKQKLCELEEKQILLYEELDSWNDSKEPEPERSSEKQGSRARRISQMGAPLYEVCDFSDRLSEDERAQLEATLEQAGILDAWILPGGELGYLYQEEGEEVWIEPAEKLDGKTLLDVLMPTPSTRSGLSEKDIQIVLGSFAWKQPEKMNDGLVSLRGWNNVGKGQFKIGVLSGKNQSKARPEYIGKETRLETKKILIERLRTKIHELDGEKYQIAHEIERCQERQTILTEEINKFPNDTKLQECLEELIKESFHLKEIINQEREAEKNYREKEDTWKEIKIKFTELTSSWVILKTLDNFQEGMRSSEDYKILLIQLHSTWLRYNEMQKYFDSQTEFFLEIQEQVESDQEEIKVIEKRKLLLEIQMKQLKDLMVSMGLDEIHMKISKCKRAQEELGRRIVSFREELLDNRGSQGELKNAYSEKQSQLQDALSRLELHIVSWNEEMGLALTFVEEVDKEDIQDHRTIINICNKIVKEYEKEFGQQKKEPVTNDLLEKFSKVNINLREYVLERETLKSGRLLIWSNRDRMNPMTPKQLLTELQGMEEEQKILLTERDQRLYAEIIIGSVGKTIRAKIHRAYDWIERMDRLMRQRNTSSGLRLSLKWVPLPQKSESELDTETLVNLLLSDTDRMDDSEIDKMLQHFKKRIALAKETAKEEQGSLRKYMNQILDYRSWFEFRLDYRKGSQSNYRELTNNRFNVLSGGEKAMAMYIPLFAAANSRYGEAGGDAPKIISLDEAFAGVDDSNMRDMFELLTDMDFDYIMTSQVLWGCYDTVPNLAIYEIYRPKDVDIITLLHYKWNGRQKLYVEN